jgi:HAD superfamily hydrolase (TIGR01662 family)
MSLLDLDLVVPTVGRRSLKDLLDVLVAERWPGRLLLVDDRRRPRSTLLPAGPPPELDVVVLAGRAAGPAAARNVGWRAATASWVGFLDDDVVPEPGWVDRLAEDIEACSADVAATKGRILVPLSDTRRPTDWERNVHGLERARWVTADMAYRRDVLRAVSGFDERFPRAYREDADLALRVKRAGWELVVGRRQVRHPVRPAPWHVSVTKQAGNADDVLMGRLHGSRWRIDAEAPAGAFRRHLATTLLATVALTGVARRQRRAAAAGATAWSMSTLIFAWKRIQPGPRDRGEVAAMVLTSVAIPPVAVAQRLRGELHARRPPRSRPLAIDAVLFDRDGTLVVDVAYNGDPDRVSLVPGARDALRRLRAAGIRTGIVTNQSGIARGLLTRTEADDVNARVVDLVGPMGAVAVCEHGPDDGCDCRKPRPGLVRRAAADLGVAPERCAVVGDIGSDVDAARAAGALGILVPTRVTRREEIAAAPVVAGDLATAVDIILGGAR